MSQALIRYWPQGAAVLTGGLLTLMVLFNGRLAVEGTPLFASLAAHGTGAVAAGLVLGILALTHRQGARSRDQGQPPAPLWAYLGGVSGAVTVMLTSVTVNSPLALAGTLALGLAGQVVFGLAGDLFGLFGLPKRRLGLRTMTALGLIAAGSLVLIYFGKGPV